MRRTLHYELLSCDIVVRQSHAINRTRDIGLNAKSLIYIMQINEKKQPKVQETWSPQIWWRVSGNRMQGLLRQALDDRLRI